MSGNVNNGNLENGNLENGNLENGNLENGIIDKNNLDEWVSEKFAIINDSLTLFKMQISSLQKTVKTIEKEIKKEIKSIQKNKKKDIQKEKRTPSGFAKPTKVTKELCDFMNKPEGSEIARTEVTKALVNYIKKNNLIETTDETKNKIIPDEKLRTLLGIHQEDINDLNYFNIQKYMNKHFYSKKTIDLDT